MSKAVLMSINPKWVELILNGKKTIEVRKTAPKLETPFKCYIYCTKQGKMFFHGGIGEKQVLFRNPDTNKIKFDYSFELMFCKNVTENNFLSGKVVAEFTCDEIEHYDYSTIDGVDIDEDILVETRLSWEEINLYANGKVLYGWHISDLKIYDKPKELEEFKNLKGEPIKNAYQSWGYINE